MTIKNIELTLLKIDKREGVGKNSGKDYLFYNASVVDDEGSVFGFILDEKIANRSCGFVICRSDVGFRCSSMWFRFVRYK